MIYKNKFSLGFAFLAASMTMVSCGDDDTLKDVRNVKPVVTLNAVTAQATEGDEVTFTLTVDTPLASDMDFKLELVDSESTASFRDFTTSGEETDISGGGGYGQGKIGYTFTFPAFAKTFSFTVTPEIDLQVEGNEVIKLLLRSSGNSNGIVAAGSEYITINVADYATGDLGMELVWAGNTTDAFGTIHEGTYMSGSNEVSLTDFDFDIYVFDENFNEVSGYAAATGASPEKITLLTADLPDGSYTVVVDLYEAGPAANTPFDLDVKLNIAKYGTWYKSIAMDYNSSSLDSSPNGLGNGVQIAGIVIKAGSTYTLTNELGDVLATGKTASSFKSNLNNAVSKARLNK